MEAQKRRRLESRGWKVGTVKEFLDLSDAEAEMIEIKLSLSRALAERRKQLGYTQEGIAKAIRSSQSRVAKMEAGDRSVSLDLLVHALLTLGTTRAGLSKAMRP